MPLLGFAIPQPCFSNNLVEFRSEINSRSKFVGSNDRGLGMASTFYWKTFFITKKVGKDFDLGRFEVWRGRLMINAVATFEVADINCTNKGVKGYQNVLRMDIESGRSNIPVVEQQSSSEDSKELSEREKLRRMRISKANKGNTPWNKGRKHSPETVQKIRERTRLAMQDPKIKMKLINLGHAQSEETKIKIGKGVRLGWEKRRGRLELQETCHYEWLNLIAEAARKGLSGEQELQWDSYNTLSKHLEQEWLQSVEERKNMPRSKGNKRAPKSAEQKRKIAEAIAAKWADPDYRGRVCSSLAKFHGSSERVARKPRPKPSGDREIRKSSPVKKDYRRTFEKNEMNVQRAKVKKAKAPSYKDPLVTSKLEMIKNIRAQRTATVNRRSEAIFKAKLLIAEAEKAATALETAAQSSPHVQASLAESRMLIAKAVEFIESIKDEDPALFADSDSLSNTSINPEEETTNPNNQTGEIVNHGKVNGVHTSPSRDIKIEDLGLDKFVFPDRVNGTASNSCQSDKQASFLSVELNHKVDEAELANEHTHQPSMSGLEVKPETGEVKIVKKRVRGRLVEVREESC